jgi:SpoVK/Ycf46/Vps4 family AAA+-type ATPase
MIALLSGPPGTGKTLLAGVIARELGLELYQVDLSCVMSKWLGETEKQLARLFDHAQRAHAVLLFDEADALFAKRRDTEGTTDRHANLTVNFLLQRLEQYRGIAVLTTNRPAGLDEALQRRLSLHLRFDIPDADERERLWRSLMPADAPLADDVDVARLAADLRLTGGYIKNVVVRAAFLAAIHDTSIDQALLRHAAALELEDMGRVIHHGPVAPIGRVVGDYY